MNLTRELQEKLSEVTTTICYERAGFGGSETGPDPRSARQIAVELKALLSALKIDGPVVLVGHSAGALFSRVFAHAYPELVEGLIMVDPVTERLYEHQRQSDPERWAGQPAHYRKFAKLPPGYVAQYSEIPRTIGEAQAAWPLPEVPVAIFTAQVSIPGEWGIDNESDMAFWLECHKDLANRIPQANHFVEPLNHIAYSAVHCCLSVFWKWLPSTAEIRNR